MAFPGSKLAYFVDLALDADLTADPSTWAWTDVSSAPTSYVRAVPITITRGGRDGGVQAPASSCTFWADNRDGRWVPTNPTGAWYGQIGKGTPIRIRTTESSSSVRWTGFLTSLPPRWNTKETDRYVQVTASGILQRLERGKTPLRSPLVRAISSTTPTPVAYWPGEDDSQATTIAEFSGHAPLTWTGTVTPSSDGPDGSKPLPEFTQFVGVRGNVHAPANTGEWQVAGVFNMPSAPSGTTVLLRWNTTGTYPVWQIALNLGSPDTLSLEAFDSAGTQQIADSMTFGTSGAGDEPYGTWLLITANGAQDGADVDYNLAVYDATSGAGLTATETGITAGAVTVLSLPSTAKTNGMHMGHWAVWNDALGTFPIDPAAISGFTGDTVDTRIARLSQELPIDVLDTTPVTMGPQRQEVTYLDLARDCEAVSNGRLIEQRDPTVTDAYLRLILHTEIENQAVDLALNHNSKHLAPPFEPTDDDQYLGNDWTATRIGGSGTGSSARVVATGTLAPDKVGTYADSISVNVELDSQLPDQAGWRVDVGTVEGVRVPTLTLDFARNPSLIASWITCDIGSRITITNPPTGIAPDTIDLLIEGWTEVLGPHTWTVYLNCSPYRPWHVFQLAETSSDTSVYLGRLAGDEKCALRAAISSSATSATVDPNRYFWTTDSDDFPLNIRMGGEVATVSSIATTAATFVNVGAALSADNLSRTPSLPASVAAGDLLVIVAAIRSSGTGTVNVPSGYTRLPIWRDTDNVAVMAKVHSGSESNPTVTFNNGVAGDSTTAFVFAFRGTPVSLTDLTDIVVGDPLVQLNAAAQNIAYGGVYPWFQERCIQLIVGWKQDDYTSVAPPTGFTEMIEASTTGGNDQSLYVAYKIDTTPTLTPEGSLAVTGGASAISRSAVFCIASGYQTFTISARNVNSISGGKAQTANTKVEVDDPAVLAL